jgi:hypothetical protein
MRKIVVLTLVSFAFSWAADLKLGKPLTLKQATPIASLAGEPEKYVGKTVQAEGKVTEVCQNMGCWMVLVDNAGKSVRLKVKDGEIVFPKDAVGKIAVAEGRWVKLELTKEQAIARAKHEAEENGKPFEPSSITGPMTIYQIQGTGAVVRQ